MTEQINDLVHHQRNSIFDAHAQALRFWISNHRTRQTIKSDVETKDEKRQWTMKRMYEVIETKNSEVK